MKTKFLFLVICLLLALSGCSKPAGKTAAKLKLKLSGIIDFTSGVGSAGAILFGRSSTGEQFGKILSNAEENLELTNGDWVFYAVMWKNTGAGNKFGDLAYCGKGAQKLTGTAVSIAMSLTNGNCEDNDFSGGIGYDKYMSGLGYVKHFADLYLEECDDLASANSYTCKLFNQGSALSYRLAFRSYRRGPGGALAFTNDVMYSACTAVGAMLDSVGLQTNFPTSKSGMPFIASVEMFLGNKNCDLNDPKGVFTYTFDQGVGESSPTNRAVTNNGYSCSPVINDEPTCRDLYAIWDGSCSVPSRVTNFVPVAECSNAPTAPTVSTPRYLKQMVSIPQPFLCRNNAPVGVGAEKFPGGEGSDFRPFKICNEWQINQIGENDTSSVFSNFSYKLMSDLDMNKTDFTGAYPKPSCLGTAGAIVTDHHNFNPLDKITDGSCTTTYATGGFSGHFNGNNKTIANARVVAETVPYLGFVRALNSSGWIRNLNFKNLEVRGLDYVGGVAGSVQSNAIDTIAGIKMDKLELEGNSSNGANGSYVGSVAGTLSASSVARSIIVDNAKVRGRDYVGGLVGMNLGLISQSMFRGVIRNESTPSNYVGGLVGKNTSGSTIEESFSEGALSSMSKNTGGIAGYSDGIIKNFYSLMNVSVNYNGNASEASVGGIVAIGGGSGSITNGYFDGLVAYSGPTALGNYKFAAGVSSTYNNCFNDGGNSSICGLMTYAGLRTASSYTIYSADLPKWKLDTSNVLLPRLSWETRECFANMNKLPVSAQITIGRGSFLNPVIICTSTQLMQMTSAATYHYRILDDLNLSNITKANFIPNFAGILDGTDRSLYGLSVTMSTDSVETVGLVNINSGTIKNLFLIGNSITNNDASDTSTGILAGRNLGTISNIKVRGSVAVGRFHVGAIAGENGQSAGGGSGVIEKIDMNNVTVQGEAKIGGVTGINYQTGKVSKVRVNMNMSKANGASSSVNSLGGVAGLNYGQIDQAEVDGSVLLTTSTASASLDLGGIVGNNIGSVTNTMSTDRFKITVADTANVGGLIGVNTGLLQTSFALGKTFYSNAGSPATTGLNFHSLVGLNTGNMASNYFLENTAASLIVSGKQTQTCSYYAVNDNRFGTDSTSNFALASMNKPDAIYLQNSGGSLSLLTPATIVADYTMSVAITCPTTLTNYDALKLYTLGYTTGIKTANNFIDPSVFINNGTLWDMGYLSRTTPGSSIRESDVLDFYKTQMYGLPTPANVPVWVMEEGEKFPSLLQVHD